MFFYYCYSYYFSYCYYYMSFLYHYSYDSHIMSPIFLNDYIMFSLCIDRFDTFSDHTTLSTPFIRFVSVIKSTKYSLFLYTNSEAISKLPTCIVVDKISFISDIFFAVRCS